jgi:hypothetical protein
MIKCKDQTACSIKVGNDSNDQMDCPTVEDGDFNALKPLAILAPPRKEMNAKYYNTRNRPLYDLR